MAGLWGVIALACLATACDPVDVQRAREVGKLPELYWEQVKQCRRRELTMHTEHCEVTEPVAATQQSRAEHPAAP